MTKLEKQIRELSPSVKDALYRRLLFAEDLAWLREENKPGTVIGFEVMMNDQELSGFALIAIQRHTVIAFVSDRNEEPKLILFPSLDILFDPGFELLDLMVIRKEFKDSTFSGMVSKQGRFGDMVKDLTPPERKVDISDIVLDQISNIITTEEGTSQVKPAPAPTPVRETAAPASTAPEPVTVYEESPEYEEGPPEGFVDEEPNNFDDYTEPGYDDYEDYDTYEEPEPKPEEPLSRSEQIRSQTFASLNDVIDFAVMKLHVNRPLAVTLANKAMQSKVSPQYRVELAVNIFCKLIDENKI